VADPAFTQKPGVPEGRVIRFTMNSAESKIFPTAPVPAPRAGGPGPGGPPAVPPNAASVPGAVAQPPACTPAWTEPADAPAGPPVAGGRAGAPGGGRGAGPAQPPQHQTFERQVAVYVPAGYVPNTPAPFIVVQDGMSPTYRNNLPTILDNLIHEKRVPLMVAVMVHNGGGDAQGSQRGLEYDTVSGVYTDFIETEVLPRITKDYGIVFTKDPEGRATMGGSSGAACAFTMAWFHPELYRRVLSYSGTYVNQQSPLNPASPRGAWEYHATLIPNNPAKPIRVWMHVSEFDNRYGDQEETWHNWVLANDRMAAALKAKGYRYQYVYSRDSRHVDRAVVAQTLPEALEWLWRGYPK